MKTRLVLAALVAMLIFGLPAQSLATIINFDDLATPNGGVGQSLWGSVPANYNGFVWTKWEVTLANGAAGSYQAVYGNGYGATSYDNFAFNADGVSISTTTGAVFDFIGAQVTSWAQNNAFQTFSSQTLTVSGYLAGVMVHGPTVVQLSPSSFNPMTLNWAGVDELRFASDGPSRWWGLDDFEYHQVPDGGGALALLGGAMMGLGVIRRRFRF